MMTDHKNTNQIFVVLLQLHVAAWFKLFQSKIYFYNSFKVFICTKCTNNFCFSRVEFSTDIKLIN